MNLLVSLTFLFLVFACTGAAATCFLRSGDVDETGLPCHPENEQSHCCRQDEHVCLSNNLCFDWNQNHVIEGLLNISLSSLAHTDSRYVGSCTDTTWATNNCSQYCKNTVFSTYGDLRQCDGQNDFWTCGQDVSSCSNSFTVPKGYIDDRREGSHSVYSNIPTAVAASFAPSAAATTVSITVTASTASLTSTISNTGTTQSCSETTVGLRAGLGVGIPLLLAVVVSQVLLWRANKKVQHLRRTDQHQHQPLRELGADRYHAEIDGRNIHEAPYQKRQPGL